jgi:probable HAF family extracellular repeat protein
LIPADFYLTITSARAINSDGQIAADTSYCGVILTPATTATPVTYEVQEDLCTLVNGSSFPVASDINDAGKAVGTAVVSWDLSGIPTNWYGFLYDEGATPKLRNLGSYSSLSSMNNFGKAVGGGSIYDSVTQQWQNLGTIGGCSSGNAYDINDSDQVVGVWHTCDGSPRAFLKESAQPMIDLNTLIPADSGWTITSASAINNHGKIAAIGRKGGGEDHALLLTPTSSDTPPPEDTEAPSPPSITSPQTNSYDKVGSFSVSGSAEASSTVELLEGTTSKGTTKADSSSGAWSIPLTGISEGAHTYFAKATDVASNTSSASDSITVTVDRTAPTVSKVHPASGATTVARNTSVTARFSEDVDGTTLKVDTFMLGKGKLSASQLTSATRIASQTTVSYEPTTQTATLDPYGSTTTTLVKCQWYTAKLTSKVKDKAGNPAIQKLWQFKTLC